MGLMISLNTETECISTLTIVTRITYAYRLPNLIPSLF